MRALILALCLLAPVHAQFACISLPDARAALATRYGEAPRVSGFMSNNILMIVTAGEAGGWSVLLVTPDGQACMVASGEAFEMLPDEPQGVDG
jgi:hypothetical protein